MVDAVQGVEAQTLANVNLALNHKLVIIPIINKTDLPAADPDRVKGEIEETLMIQGSETLLASAKQGLGIEGNPPSRRGPNSCPWRQAQSASTSIDLRQPF